MISVLHLRKQLFGPPVVLAVPGVRVRQMRVPNDVPAWLALRALATEKLVPAVRPWTHDDFQTEIVQQPWWRGEWTWLAVVERKLSGDLCVAGLAGRAERDTRTDIDAGPARHSSPAVDADDVGATSVGTVTLAMRRGNRTSMPVIHWLLVDPAWRCLGIGRVLVSHLEKAVWDDGWREVQLETHIGWTEAVAFYQSIGYAPVRDCLPR